MRLDVVIVLTRDCPLLSLLKFLHSLPVEVAKVLPSLVIQAFTSAVKYFLVLRDYNTSSYSEVIFCVVINQWLVVRITNDAHHRLEQSLSCTHIPVLEARYQVDIEICLLVEHVDDFVASSCHSCDMLGLECVQNLVHTLLICVHTSADPHIVVIVFN